MTLPIHQPQGKSGLATKLKLSQQSTTFSLYHGIAKADQEVLNELAFLSTLNLSFSIELALMDSVLRRDPGSEYHLALNKALCNALGELQRDPRAKHPGRLLRATWMNIGRQHLASTFHITGNTSKNLWGEKSPMPDFNDDSLQLIMLRINSPSALGAWLKSDQKIATEENYLEGLRFLLALRAGEMGIDPSTVEANEQNLPMSCHHMFESITFGREETVQEMLNTAVEYNWDWALAAFDWD